MDSFNLMQTVKRSLYARRNGALAEQMRRGGLMYRINFGLNIPQVKEVAAEILAQGLSSKEQLDLANLLWENVNTRESRLIAPMLYPADIMTADIALRWLMEAQTTEIADHLCHSLLRHLPFAPEVAHAVLADTGATPLNRYAALRLMLNLLILGKIAPSEAAAAAAAEQATGTPLTRAVAAQLADEAEFRGL